MRLLIAVAVLTLAISASAQEVTANLSSDSVAVGEPVQFQISTKGRTQARLLDGLAVDGLEVVSTSDQFQMQMQFPGRGMQVMTTLTFVIVPLREGEFSIPPLRLRLDGKVFKTLPTVLSVTEGIGVPTLPAIPVPPGGGAAPQTRITPFGQPPSAQPTPGTRSRGTFGEIVIPQETAYVGEVVPVELRFYVDARLPAELSAHPNFGGEGFTVQRMAPPAEFQREIDGIPYNCVVYRTAITPVKAGKLEIPSVSLPARVQVPVSAPRGMDDFFGGMLRNFGMTDVREVEILSEPVTLDIKPLPTEGRPEGFAGAVGSFEIEVSASPQKPAAGEPVTLSALVTGRGNFEAMGPPSLADTEGWRTYDPAENFEPSPTDPIGLHGEKTYDFTLLALQDQQATPSVQFSYFDPGSEQYVVLEGPPIAMDAPGSGQAPSSPSSTDAAPSQPLTTPEAKLSDGLSRDYTPATFRPLAWGSGFIYPAIALASLWLLGLGSLLVRRHLTSPAAARAAHLRDLRRSLKALADPSMPQEEFLQGAWKFLEVRRGEQDVESLDLDEGTRQHLASLLELHGQSLYSTKKSPKLDHETRSLILAALAQLDKTLGRP